MAAASAVCAAACAATDALSPLAKMRSASAMMLLASDVAPPVDMLAGSVVVAEAATGTLTGDAAGGLAASALTAIKNTSNFGGVTQEGFCI